MKLSRIFFLLLTLFLFVPSFVYPQSAGKPKLGSGTITGKIEKTGTCMGVSGGICVRVGKYLLDLSTEGSPSTVFVGDEKLLTKGRTVRVTYSSLENSEMDLGRLFTGHANRVVIAATSSSGNKKRKS